MAEPVPSAGTNVFVPEGGIVDARFGARFYELLQEFMQGPPDLWEPADRQYYRDWWCDHAGRRSTWFQGDLLPRLERNGPIAGKALLDFGCGTGSSTAVFAAAGAKVVGVEPDEVPLRLARQRVADLGFADSVRFVQIPYLKGEGDRIDLPSASFDIATLTGVLEHMLPHETEHCIREVHRLLKPGGEAFVFDTPNRAHPFDYHTTRLWFLGWMPRRWALRYSKMRKRMADYVDLEAFHRRGANGLSRRAIDRIFAPPQWELAYEMSGAEGLYHFQDLAEVMPWLPSKRRPAVRAVLRATGRAMLWSEKIRKRPPACFFKIHVRAMRKRA